MGSLYNFIFYIYIYIYIYIICRPNLFSLFTVYFSGIFVRKTARCSFLYIFSSPPFSAHSQATENCFLFLPFSVQIFFSCHFRRYETGVITKILAALDYPHIIFIWLGQFFPTYRHQKELVLNLHDYMRNKLLQQNSFIFFFGTSFKLNVKCIKKTIK